MQLSKWMESGLFLLLLLGIGMGQVAAENLLQNPTFQPNGARVPPLPWLVYGTMNDINTITLVNADDPQTRALRIVDGTSISRGSAGEIGITQTVAGKAGQHYRLSAQVKQVGMASTDGVYLQLRFLPSGVLHQVELSTWSADQFEEIAVEGEAPPGTTQVRAYVWTGAQPTPQILVREVSLTPFTPEPIKEFVWTVDEVKQGMKDRYGELQPGQVAPKVGLYITAEDVANARRLAQEQEWARKLVDSIVSEADFWVKMPDDWYRSIMPPKGSIFSYGETGCPIDGSSWARFGANGVADFSRPYTLRCTNGQIINFNDPDSPYYDPGPGITINGVLYQLRGIWNSYVTSQLVGTGSDAIMQNLAYAYALTGDVKYANKAILIMDLVATLSPTTIGPRDFTTSTTAIQGRLHWYTSIVHRAKMRIMNAYDLLYHVEGMHTPSTSQPGMTVAQNIEQNLILDYLFGEYDPRQGILKSLHNHEADSVRAMLGTGLLLGEPDYIRWGLESLSYFLDNTINRDGMYYETSPSYSEFSRGVFLDMMELAYNYNPENYSTTSYAELFPQPTDFAYNLNYYDHPSVRNFVYGYRERIDAGGHRPAYGNSSMPTGQATLGAVDLATWQAVLRFRERASQPEWQETFTEWLTTTASSTSSSRYDLWALFHSTPLPSSAGAGKTLQVPSESALLGAASLSILRSKTNTSNAIEMRGGPSLPHGHDDVLGFNIYSGGYHLTWDIGYGISGSPVHLGWGTRSIAHNLVVVNEAQNRNGTYHQIGPGASTTAFSNGKTLDLIEMDAANHYPADQLTNYRRSIIQVETSAGPYFLDLFRVTGGLKHDYSFHARAQNTIYEGLALTEHPTAWTLDGLTRPQASTNAKGRSWGERIIPGEFVKDLGIPGEEIGGRLWTPPPGNGYAFLYNLREGKPQADLWQVVWPASVGYRIRMTHLLSAGSANAQQSVYDALAPDLLGQNRLRYVIERRESSDGNDLDSLFAHLFESYRTEPIVKAAQPLAVESASVDGVGFVIDIDAAGTRDYILYGGPEEAAVQGEGLEWQGHTAVIRVAQDQVQQISLVGGQKLSAFGWTIATQSAWRGRIVSADSGGRYVSVDATLPANDILADLTVLFDNPAYLRNSPYAIRSVATDQVGSILDLGETSFDLARAMITKLGSDGRLESSSPLPTGHAYGVSTGYLTGREVQIERTGARLHVDSVPAFTMVQLAQPAQSGEAAVGDPFVIRDIQSGDEFMIRNVVELQQLTPQSWQVRISAPTTITWPFAASQVQVKTQTGQLTIPVHEHTFTLDPTVIGSGSFVMSM
jgi:hypothetical protein